MHVINIDYIINYRWLNTDAKIEDHLLEYDSRSKTLMSQNEEGIVIVEYRDLDGTVIHFEEPEFSEATGRKLHKVDINKVDMNKVDINKVDFNKVVINTVDINRVDINKVDINKVDINRVNIKGSRREGGGWFRESR